MTVPPRVIMNIDNTMRARLQARLHKFVIFSKIGFVQSTAHNVIDEILPADGEAKDVESVVFGKVRHLAGTVAAAVLREWRIDRANGTSALSVGVSKT